MRRGGIPEFEVDACSSVASRINGAFIAAAVKEPEFRVDGMLNVVDLFAGIGSASLALEATGGFASAAFSEIDSFCVDLLRRRWPHVPCYGDIRELRGDELRAAGVKADVIAAGFPCQEISCAGTREGIGAPRAQLWRECARLIGDLRPKFALVENSAELRHRGLGRVLGDLAALGYDAEWHCIPAAALGAPHRRDRIWILAHKTANGPHPHCITPRRLAVARRECNFWDAEPGVGRVGHGVPRRVDRLRALGNSAVPQIIRVFGEAILELEMLRLPELQISSVEERGNQRLIRVRRRQEHRDCPNCGSSRLSANGAKRIKVRDVPVDGRPVLLLVDRQRFVCIQCGKSSYDTIDAFDGRRRMTRRLVGYIKAETRKEAYAVVAHAVGVDEKTVRLVAKSP